MYDHSGRISPYPACFSGAVWNCRKYERAVHNLHCFPHDALHGSYFYRIAAGGEDTQVDAEYGDFGEGSSGSVNRQDERIKTLLKVQSRVDLIIIMTKLGVVLVNYNGIEYNEACIESIRASDWDGEILIFCVDNDSQDGSPARLEECYGDEVWFHLIRMGKNTGFATANNRGLHEAVRAGCDCLMLLNNDTCIRKDMIRKLVAGALSVQGKACIVAPKIYYWDHKDTIWSAGGYLTSIVKKPVSRGEGEKDTGKYRKKKECTYLNGCCMFLPAETFLKIGDMDEDFFLYYEDTEYCMRAREKGIRLLYCPGAKMYHKVSASTGGSSSPACAYYISRNWPMCMRKRMEKWRFPLFLIYFLINRTACFLLWTVQGRGDLVRAGGAGVVDFLMGRNRRTAADV